MAKRRKKVKKPIVEYDFRWGLDSQAREGEKNMAKYHRNLTELGYVLRITKAGTLIYEKFA